MKTILVDDEILSLKMLEYMLQKMPEIEILASFTDPEKALDFLKSNSVNLAFLDIEMPVVSGIDIAKAIKNTTRVIFITAYPQYSIDAWDVEAVDYILKPFDGEKVRRAVIKAGRLLPETQASPFEVRCFPKFNILADGVPCVFKNRKAKEFLAYLVHNQGSWCSIDEVTFAVLEDMNEDSGKNYLRQIIYRLRSELKNIGLPGILISEYGKYRVNLDGIPCDYYDYLKGNRELFKGEYMNEYSWAEPKQAWMIREMQSSI